jgi:hypothetical protein
MRSWERRDEIEEKIKKNEGREGGGSPYSAERSEMSREMRGSVEAPQNAAVAEKGKMLPHSALTRRFDSAA